MIDPRLLPEGTDWVVVKDSAARGQPGREVARSLQCEVREGREAVMPELGLGLILAGCESPFILQEAQDGNGLHSSPGRLEV